MQSNFFYENESIMRPRWQNNTAVRNTGKGGHVGDDQVPVC